MSPTIGPAATRSGVDADASAVINGLLEMLHLRARNHGSATAVITQSATVSWSEVASDTEQLTIALRDRGVGPGTSVALVTGRSRYAWSALLATWACGATAVLIDERHPAERTAHALRDSGARYLLADQIEPALLSLGAPILPVAGLIAAVSQAKATGWPTAGSTAIGTAALAASDLVAAENAAYLIYTSGTTGLPKGVEVSYANLDAFIRALHTLKLPAGGVGVNAVSPAFDGWLWCSLLYLVYGQSLGIIDLAVSEAAGVGAAIDALAPRVVCLTPSLLAACDSELAGAEVVVAAGEVCPPELIARFAAGRRMLNVYGPTEATIAATWADTAHGHDLTTIGVPLPGYLVYVLDEERRQVPPGEPGELHIGGPAVARGYRNLPELTAQRFSADPLNDSARLYATGDLVRQRPDGTLQFIGRADTQVKVRGFRVELEELERQAQLIPGVAQATAFVLAGGQSLGLAVRSSARTPAPSDADLRRRLGTTLPEYLVPTTILRPDAFPVTSTGKVDREALAARCGAAVEDRAAVGQQPASAAEAVIAGIWSRLLEAPVTDVDANFFEVGGHSLLAARLVAAVREATGVSVSMRDLLATPTIAALAAIVDRQVDQDETRYVS